MADQDGPPEAWQEWRPPEPSVVTFYWYGAHADVRRHRAYSLEESEDARESAFLDVVMEQFRQWGPERSARFLRAVSDRVPAEPVNGG